MRLVSLVFSVLLAWLPTNAAWCSESAAQAAPLYHERYRPQFHFTAQKNWLNDPNGLVYHKGEYHLFFQHNPQGIDWGNMTWGHAVSTDLVHWKQLEHALLPDANGVCFSGSAVIDRDNTSGLKTGDEQVMVAIYTSHDKTERQSLAYSNDRGRTWNKFPGNPVLHDADRDPKVIWHAPTKKWVMTLFSKGGISFYGSPDLKTWTFLSKVPDFHECPDIFELPVDGNASNTRWVLHGAPANKYLIGRFDGTRFTPESDALTFDHGKNFYAAQSFSDIPKEDGRRIQIAWMRGGSYPGMPFNQQMSFPCALTLRTFPEGIRMCREPVREIATLRAKEHRFADRLLKPGENLLGDIQGDLFEIQAELELAGAAACGLRVCGEAIDYNVSAKTLSVLGAKAPLEPVDHRIRLHILVDRTSIETFGNDGKVSLSSCFLPKQNEKPLEIYAVGGNVRVLALDVYELKSAW